MRRGGPPNPRALQPLGTPGRAPGSHAAAERPGCDVSKQAQNEAARLPWPWSRQEGRGQRQVVACVAVEAGPVRFLAVALRRESRQGGTQRQRQRARARQWRQLRVPQGGEGAVASGGHVILPAGAVQVERHGDRAVVHVLVPVVGAQRGDRAVVQVLVPIVGARAGDPPPTSEEAPRHAVGGEGAGDEGWVGVEKGHEGQISSMIWVKTPVPNVSIRQFGEAQC
jgi:hypothetical protein